MVHQGSDQCPIAYFHLERCSGALQVQHDGIHVLVLWARQLVHTLSSQLFPPWLADPNRRDVSSKLRDLGFCLTRFPHMWQYRAHVTRVPSGSERSHFCILGEYHVDAILVCFIHIFGICSNSKFSSLIFFGGLSIHLSKAILAHLFSYNITWGATKKEVERSNFFLEVPKILSRFRVALLLSFLTIAAIVVMALPFFPADWSIPYTNWSGKNVFHTGRYG